MTQCQSNVTCPDQDTQKYWFRTASGFTWAERLCAYHADRKEEAESESGGMMLEDVAAE